jgi:hydroxypyruvate reductase
VRTEFVLAGSRRDAMVGAAAEAERLGYQIHRLDPPTLGAAREAAQKLVADFTTYVGAILRSSQTGPDVRLAMISSGETTVALPPDNRGRGGRNQEFALAAALAMTALRGEWVFASVGTDGIDGPTDAAGAIADSSTLERAIAAGLDPTAALASHDSYPFFQRLSDLVVTGPTGTNVGDLQIFVGSIISV